MAEVTDEMLLAEALKLQTQVRRVQCLMSETLALLRQTNAELAEGRKKIDAARRQFEENQTGNMRH